MQTCGMVRTVLVEASKRVHRPLPVREHHPNSHSLVRCVGLMLETKDISSVLLKKFQLAVGFSEGDRRFRAASEFELDSDSDVN